MNLQSLYARIRRPDAVPPTDFTRQSCAQLWLYRCELAREYYEAAAAGQLPHILAAIEQEVQDVSDELVRRQAAGRTPFTLPP